VEKKKKNPKKQTTHTLMQEPLNWKCGCFYSVPQ